MNAWDASLFLILTALLATGCLFSEDPLLTPSTGDATPLQPGAYNLCSYEPRTNKPDCSQTTLTFNEHGLYRLDMEGEDAPSFMRLRARGKNAFGVQISMGEDGGFAYFFGKSQAQTFVLRWMSCPAL